MDNNKKEVIYLAGPLFNAAERLHLVMLEQSLRALGYDVILPQRQALKFLIDGVLNLQAMAMDCMEQCRRKDVIYVGCLDGAEADSGTAVEYALAIGNARAVITYRTDFRTSIEDEVGVNAMLNLPVPGTAFIYHPCFVVEKDEIRRFHDSLAAEIRKKIIDLTVSPF